MLALKQFTLQSLNTRVQLTEAVLSGAEDAPKNHQAELSISNRISAG